MKKGFTLMEVIVAVGIVTSVLVFTIALINFSVSGIRLNKSKIIAFGLAQEGEEIVRNIRDNNWLNHKRAVSNWRDGLADGDYIGRYDSQALSGFSSVPLKLDSNGFYQYNNGTNTIFYRKITLARVDDNQMKATVQITWQEKGANQSLNVESRLYNWLKD